MTYTQRQKYLYTRLWRLMSAYVCRRLTVSLFTSSCLWTLDRDGNQRQDFFEAVEVVARAAVTVRVARSTLQQIYY